MAANALNHDADGGTICIRCGEALIAPERSEQVSEGLVRNFWACSKCGCRFDAEVPADSKSAIDADTMEAFFPSLLVA